MGIAETFRGLFGIKSGTRELSERDREMMREVNDRLDVYLSLHPLPQLPFDQPALPEEKEAAAALAILDAAGKTSSTLEPEA